MTCQIGSEEPQWNQQHRAETQDGEQASKQAVAPSPSRSRRYSRNNFVFLVAEGDRRDHFCRSHVHESGVFRRHLGFSWRISR